MRVNADHWAIILDFAEKNPSIITNRFPGCNGKEKLTELWKQLSNKLNALGYGEKTTAEWKKTLTDWKSKVKGKAAGIKTYESKTGGGPSCSQQLSSYELRLLSIMGNSSYEGNPKNVEVGLKKRKLHDDIRLGHNTPDKPKLILLDPNKTKPYIPSTHLPATIVHPSTHLPATIVHPSTRLPATIVHPSTHLPANIVHHSTHLPATIVHPINPESESSDNVPQSPKDLHSIASVSRPSLGNQILKNINFSVTKLPSLVTANSTPDAFLQSKLKTQQVEASLPMNVSHDQKSETSSSYTPKAKLPKENHGVELSTSRTSTTKQKSITNNNAMSNMHNELLDVLIDINTNINWLASSGSQLVKLLKK
uniref:Regulatory protein zeste n=1 Tax=Diabrotica virgifera virgifera TaxID=50390 RepID=A0A6P7GXW9_DIAVI